MRFRRRNETVEDAPVVREDGRYNETVVRDDRPVRRPLDAAAPAAYEERVTRSERAGGPDAGPAYSEHTTRTSSSMPDAPVYEDRVAAPAYEESVMTDRHVGYRDSLPARLTTLLFAALAMVEGLIGLRFALLATGANTTSGFVDFIYDVSWPLVRPFSNAFNDRTTDSGIIEVSSLLAMGVWLLVFLLATLLINALLPRIDDRSASVRRERVTHV